jgi:hypothetical protein
LTVTTENTVIRFPGFDNEQVREFVHEPYM